MIAGGRRRGVETFPLPASGTGNTHPTYDGSGIIIHPSVVDMGARWNGYRWWRADTPYPSDMHENPSIWGSNNRTTWEVPSGLTNPIDPWPGELTGRHGWFNSDTEMVWDPDRQRLVVYWREAGHEALGVNPKWWAASSGDGRTWLHHGLCFNVGMSNTIARDPATGKWRMAAFGQPATSYLADDILGPWAPGPAITGWQDPGGVNAYHGDMIPHQGIWIAAWSANVPQSWLAASVDGYQWHIGPAPMQGYRFTLCPSTEAGYVDIWQSSASTYTRLPLTAWTTLLP